MIKPASTLLFAIIISCAAHAATYPDSILHQSFAKQALFADSFAIHYGDSVARINEDMTALEKWAGNHSDAQFKIIILLAKYRAMVFNNGGTPEMEDELHNLGAQYKKEKYLEADVLQTLGQFYWLKKKDFASALEVYIYAYNLYSQFTADEFPDKAEFQWSFGSAYYRFKDFKQAKNYYLEVFASVPMDKIDNPISKLNTIALCYRKLELFDSSLLYFESAMDLAKKRNSEAWIGLLNGNLADNLYRIGRYKEAIPMLEDDINISLKAKDTGNTAFSMSSLAGIYLEQHEPGKARQLMEKSLIMTKEGKLDPFLSKFIYSNAAKFYASTGDKTYAYDLLDSAMAALIADQKQSDLILLSGIQHKVDVQTHREDMQTKQSQLDKQRFLRNTFIAGFALVLFFTGVAYRQKKRISIEKKRSDELLLNILPDETAEELKQKGRAAARSFENVTILFTDFRDFTSVSEKMNADELVETIHHYYSNFDVILDDYHVEKIKTIGDSYMCAGGLPKVSETHAIDVVSAAVDIMHFNESEKKRRIASGKTPLDIRIGIHTGPVIAGIVGINKFAYDIWGDAVNVAKRMESSGEAGKINISETTYQRVKDQFQCTFRGEVEAKNKGMMKMYFVNWQMAIDNKQ